MEKIRDVEKWKSKDYMTRADECLRSVTRDFEAGDWNSCVISAIHAGISAADALCIFAFGRRNASENHKDAIAFFLSINPADDEIKKAAGRLADLLRIKTDAEYGDRLQTRSDAEMAKLNAERFVSFVRKRLPS